MILFSHIIYTYWYEKNTLFQVIYIYIFVYINIYIQTYTYKYTYTYTHTYTYRSLYIYIYIYTHLILFPVYKDRTSNIQCMTFTYSIYSRVDDYNIQIQIKYIMDICKKNTCNIILISERINQNQWLSSRYSVLLQWDDQMMDTAYIKGSDWIGYSNLQPHEI